MKFYSFYYTSKYKVVNNETNAPMEKSKKIRPPFAGGPKTAETLNFF